MKWTNSRVVWTVSAVTIGIVFALVGIEDLPSTDIWFDDLLGDAMVTDSELDGSQLVRSVADSFDAEIGILETVPETVRQDTVPRIVFLSVSDGESGPLVALGSGHGLVSAIENAMAEVRVRVSEDYLPRWIKLDIVDAVQPAERIEVYEPSSVTRSLEGIAFQRTTRLALLPDQLVAYTLLNSDQEMQAGNMTRFLEDRPELAAMFAPRRDTGPFEVFRFTSDSYFDNGEESFRLYRGHRIVDEMSSTMLLEAARDGGDYLTRTVRPDGSFVYTYLPKTDEEPDRYNILRHAGTIYSMLELYEVTRQDELLEAAERALDYLLRSVAYCRISGDAFPCIQEGGEVKLGGNGLAAVALAKYIDLTGDDRHRPLLVQLGRWIERRQLDSGEFFPHLETYPEGEATDFVSRYYPGEALLALVRIYAIEGDESLLDLAQRGADYLIRVRDGGLLESELDHDHWLLYALNEVYRFRPNPLYLEHSIRIARAMRGSQNGEVEYPDWAGGFGEPPASTPAATNSEGLCAAYFLVRDFGDPSEAQAIREALESAIRFQLQTQFRPESAMYLRDPARVLGGFHRTLTDFSIRIDYVQHNISSLLCAERILG